MTINEFKRAMKMDGSLKIVAKTEGRARALIYVNRQIRDESRLTCDQKDKLYDWAFDFADRLA